jgi:eukaryotic-like serine/threonine-protein kinase
VTQNTTQAAALDVVVDENWQVLRELGSGGMGKVYLARDLTLGRQVALKVLTVDGPEHRERMEREAKVLAKLDHPNVVPVYAFGSWEGRSYLVMKLVEGRTLRAVLDDPGFGLARALALLRRLGDGLDHVHERGLLHRDVKPANVIVAADDQPTLVDFGISREVAPVGDEITREGYVLATLPFASPEALTRPASIDHRSDLYSLGIICYRALTKSSPFEAAGDYEMLQKKLSCDFVSVTQKGLPAALDDVFARVFAPVPDDRYATCRELVDAIEEVLVADGMVPAPMPSSPRTSSGVVPRATGGFAAANPVSMTAPQPIERRVVLLAALGGTVLFIGGVATALVWWRPPAPTVDAGEPLPAVVVKPQPDAGSKVGSDAAVPSTVVVVEPIDAGPPPSRPAPDAGRVASPVVRSADVSVVVTVQGEPAWGEVKVDGEFQPMAPCVVRLSVGSHRVTVSHPGFAPQTRTVKIAGRDQVLRFEFR